MTISPRISPSLRAAALLAILSAVWLSAAAVVDAQPRADRQPAAVDPARAEEFRAALRDRLARRIEANEREAGELKSALAGLESGKSIADLRRDFPVFRRLIDQAERDVRFPPDGAPRGTRPGPGSGPGPEGRDGRDNRDEPGPADFDRRRGGPPGPRAADRFASAAAVMRTFDDLDELVRVHETEMPRPERPAPGQRPTRTLTPADRAAMHEYLAAAAPELDRQLRELHERDADAAADRYQRMLPRMSRVIDLKTSDPEMFAMVVEGTRLRRESGELARWIVRHEADPDMQEQVAQRRAALRQLSDRALIVAEQAAARFAQRRAAMRDELADRVVDMMIERERFRLDRDRSGPEPAGGPPPAGPAGERRPGRQRGGADRP